MMKNPLLCLKGIIILTMCLVMQLLVYAAHQCIQTEREALLQFKASLVDRYGMLSSWTTTADCCQWQGIRCSNLTRHVLSLDLHAEYSYEYTFAYHYSELVSQRYIGGEIHKSLMELQQLQYLKLSFNSFSNRGIPEFLGSLTNLRYLDLSSCSFGGKIPSQFGSLSHLKYLNLAWNSLEGSIPRQLGNLSMLQHLDLHGNSFEGNISSQLGSLSMLQHLDLSYNYFEGNIPSQLGNLSNLQELYLGGYGYLYPSALNIDNGDQWLSNLISLTHLSLDSISNLNRSHSWLQMISKLPKLRQLSLIDCSLSDHFILSQRPSKFNFSTSLSVLHLSGNTFTSSMIFPWLSNITSNLVELHLSHNLLEGSTSNHLSVVMNSLEHLDLSFNRLKGEDFKSFRNICTLHSLYMFRNDLTEDLPSILHNLSNGCVRYSLQELDLAHNQIIGSLPDLSVFSSLKRLDLSENQLSGKITEGIRLPSELEFLSIRSNSLEGGVPKSFGSTCTLESLDLSDNKLSEELSVIFNHLSGCFRYSLQELNLRNNQLKGGVPKSFQNASILRSLDLSNNNLSENLSLIIHHLSKYARYSLQELDLSMNQISGTIPNTLSMFQSLKLLSLHNNKLNGTISEDVQFPSRLEQLDLRSNSLTGVITDSNFANMSMLDSLDLSDNALTLAFTPNWAPPFQLSSIALRSCKLGPTFPKWLQTQKDYGYIDISNAGISDFVPKWFWAKVASQEHSVMNISHNKLKGMIPNFPVKNYFYYLTLGSNQFEGPIPPFLRSSMHLDVSNNKFSDSRSFLCSSGTVETLYQLDLSNNQLSEQIPDCWSHFKSLAYLNLSHNKFSGKIPTSMGSLLELQVLLLRNNNLTDGIPSSLKNCTKLVMLDMTENRLSGSFPAWIGNKLQDLKILSLGRNYFNGSLPLQICYLRSIQLLDLSINNLSGQIPKCIQNFSSMAQITTSRYYQGHRYFVNTSNDRLKGTTIQEYSLNAFLMWKGSEQKFEDNSLSLLKSIDLSSNHFSGGIPIEIENLFGLVSLNLSRNHLTGKIPSNIGKLTSLEFLDLSRNQLVGSIPLSLARIDRLSMLDLSHNNLSGEIPTGTQLQSFNASCYEDNLDLCGPPLTELCIDGEATHEAIVKVDKDELFLNGEFYISMATGFVISFWGVFGSILIKRSWRDAYFNFISNLSDAIYVMAAVKLFNTEDS